MTDKYKELREEIETSQQAGHWTDVFQTEEIASLLAERDALRDALKEITEVAERVDGWQSFPPEQIAKAKAALGEEQ